MKKLKKVFWYLIKYTIILIGLYVFTLVMLVEKYDKIMSLCLTLFFATLCIISCISLYDDIKKERRDKLMQLQWERKRIKEKINAESKL